MLEINQLKSRQVRILLGIEKSKVMNFPPVHPLMKKHHPTQKNKFVEKKK